MHESLTPIRRELINLQKLGLLTEERVANLVYYQANEEFLLFDELKNIILKTTRKDALRKKKKIECK